MYSKKTFTFEDSDTRGRGPGGGVIERPEQASFDFITCPACALVVKAGASGSSQFLFNVSDWNGQGQLSLDSFWAEQRGAISRLAIWFAGVATVVPEPGTLSLMVMMGGLIIYNLVRAVGMSFVNETYNA